MMISSDHTSNLGSTPNKTLNTHPFVRMARHLLSATSKRVLPGLVVLSFFLVITGAGCKGPQLAVRPLSPKEKEWIKAINKSYPRWKAPGHPPPMKYHTAPDQREQPEKQTGPDTAPSAEKQQQTPASKAQPTEGMEFVPVGDAGDSQQPRSAQKPKHYKVKKGDTLTGISQKFYGTPKKWRKIYNANKQKLTAPSQLSPGMKLNIPPE